MMKMTAEETKVLTLLRGHAESVDAHALGTVYLPNAQAASDLVPHAFARVLSSLRQKGFYDNYGSGFREVWGLVRMNEGNGA